MSPSPTHANAEAFYYTNAYAHTDTDVDAKAWSDTQKSPNAIDSPVIVAISARLLHVAR